MSLQPSIFADTESSRAVWIRVEGKGTFQNSPGLKEFARNMIREERRDFVVDLANCPAMDSTFMGTLAGIALRLREAGGGNLWVTHRNSRNSELLAGLGLDVLFSTAPLPECGESPLRNALDPSVDKTTTRNVMREAHEDAILANAANAARFKDVLEHLRESQLRAEKI